VLFTALLARTSATSPSNIVDEDQGIAAAWRGEAENSVGQSAAVGLTETGSSAPKGEKADWQPEDDEGELPITGWSDALSGRLDSKTSCVHIRDEISVAEERFKVNTKRSLEELYGAGAVVSMESALQSQKAALDESLRRSGCFRQDPNMASISTFAVWREDPQGSQACEGLFKQRASLAAKFQDKVRRMLLTKQPKAFQQSVDELFSVTKSLHMRLQAQGCEGALPPPSTVSVPPVANGMYAPSTAP